MSEEKKKTIEVTEDEARVLEATLRRLSEERPPTVNDLIRSKYNAMKDVDSKEFFRRIVASHKKGKK